MSHGTERVALTVVSDTKVLEELKWWQQGDAALETCDMIEARQGNRRKEEVLRQLETWWGGGPARLLQRYARRRRWQRRKGLSLRNDDGQGEVSSSIELVRDRPRVSFCLPASPSKPRGAVSVRAARTRRAVRLQLS